MTPQEPPLGALAPVSHSSELPQRIKNRAQPDQQHAHQHTRTRTHAPTHAPTHPHADMHTARACPQWTETTSPLHS
eukprot:5705184-Prymnesium_polylepis.1